MQEMNVKDLKNVSGIYKINFPNGKSYIGLSNNIARRIKEHNSNSIGNTDGLPVHLAIKKYFGKITQVEILELIDAYDRAKLQQQEQYWIEYFQTNNKDKGYNLTVGGDGSQAGIYNLQAKFDKEQINEIYDLLINHNELYIYQIAEQYNVNKDIISSINTGKHYFNPNFTYLLRKPPKPNIGKGTHNHLAKFDEKQINGIYDLLINHNEKSLEQIAKEYNVSYTTISKINRGLSYTQKDYKYPLRIRKANCKFNLQQIEIIILELQNTNKTYKELAKQFNSSTDTIRRINQGLNVSELINKYNFPIRQ